MIDNPVALYYSNLTCCASTTQDLSDFVFEKNVENINRILLPDLNTKNREKSIRNILQNTCVRPNRNLFGSHGSEYAINNTGLYGIGKCCYYFTV